MLKSALSQHKTVDIFDIVDMYARSYGFIKVWFSDKRHFFGIRDDATFYVRGGASNVSGRITGFNRSFINDFAEILSSNIGVEIDIQK